MVPNVSPQRDDETAIAHNSSRRIKSLPGGSAPMSEPRKPNPVFVEIIVRADCGRVLDLKPYVDAAHAAVMKAANAEHVYCGAIGRRGVVSTRTLARHLRKHGLFYGERAK
jgi:hypothetical protein